jgi:hypothetical protein
MGRKRKHKTRHRHVPPWRTEPPPAECLHVNVEMVKIPFVVQGCPSFHLMERCMTCGKNMRGPMKWVKHSEVTDLDSIPVIPPKHNRGPR